MNKILLKEFFSLCEGESCNIGLLTEGERKLKNDGFMILTGILQRADFRNQNGRIYKKNILEREIENYQKSIREARSYGELDHCDEAVINLKNTSHMIIRTFWNGDDVMGVIKVLKTPSGAILEGIVKSGGTIGISSRALGSLKESPQGSIVGEDLEIICWDAVSQPSVQNAYLHLNESRQYDSKRIFTKADRINRILNNILKS
jgi:hypothetical protein